MSEISEFEPIFFILDKICDAMEYFYSYYNPSLKRNINIELGNLYTIDEDDEDDEDDEEFILI